MHYPACNIGAQCENSLVADLGHLAHFLKAAAQGKGKPAAEERGQGRKSAQPSALPLLPHNCPAKQHHPLPPHTRMSTVSAGAEGLSLELQGMEVDQLNLFPTGDCLKIVY
uniref:Uncharacterized protein n=1 Tax=Sphaerodactylus townsendi TaxID=933632 RepID=A0ACB8EPH9_9SAUR